MAYQHLTKLRVRYAETDRMGYVYYGTYATYFEVARVETLKSIGVSYRELEDSGILLPVSRYEVSYLAPATYDEELHIHTRIEKMPGVRIAFDYTIENPEGKLLNKAFTELVFTDAASRKPCRPPAAILSGMESHFRESG